MRIEITWPFSLLAKDINRDDGNDDYVKHDDNAVQYDDNNVQYDDNAVQYDDNNVQYDDNAVQYDDDVGDLRSVLGTGWGR